MTQNKELADAVLFYAVKLKNSPPPRFRRKPGQIWVFHTNEAPSRFSWFVSLNRTGIRDQINWTMTHKLDSDIPIVYGRLMESEQLVEKDYDEIYSGKSRTAAWFVSHCPVRSDRSIYVARMQTRIDVDGFGACGTLTCGQAEKIPGVVALRNDADRDTCFPLLSQTYKFYLAFENSLCQEYVTEKFFKLFNNVDVVPVVRGGADYKSYFPPGTFVDAADFSSPEALADYLDDLGNDKSRYISYLRNKNRYQVVWDSPTWQCKLCEKLHVDRQKKTYKNIHAWFTTNSCVDPKDFH
ncbi:unnamed protein product [Candidula unifasciata]|uniref:Fucosyltransferase n=1 Tax=Candidula unifasciata TaxID=100452 RepID=A0A8S3ZZW4_9EUPU|nr:unnamed protein product [Candidula unifasciata]